MHHYLLRAECESDIDAFADAVRDAVIEVRDWTTFKEPGIPDTFLGFRTDATLEVLLPILEAIPDGHVMCETIGFAGASAGTCVGTSTRRSLPAACTDRDPPR